MGIRSKKRKTRSIPNNSCSALMPRPPPQARKVVDAHDLLPAQGEWRDWAALPDDVLWLVLSRIPQADILRGAGLACSAWRQLAVHEPLLWRRIDLADDEEDEESDGPKAWRPMARAAVDRSAGRCESFRGRVDGGFLIYLAHRAPLLRGLHMTCRFDITLEGQLMAGIKKLQQLQQLVLSAGRIEEPSSSLVALLDHCPRLELLDASGCHTFESISGAALVRLRRIKDLRLPCHRIVCRRRLIKIRHGLQ